MGVILSGNILRPCLSKGCESSKPHPIIKDISALFCGGHVTGIEGVRRDVKGGGFYEKIKTQREFWLGSRRVSEETIFVLGLERISQ